MFLNLQIFDHMLGLRADALCRLGCIDSSTGRLKYSSYICVSYKTMDPMVTSPSSTSPSQVVISKVTHMSLESCFNVVLSYLEQEKDWEVLKLILEKLPKLLSNKAIILSKSGNSSLNNLVVVLCDMVVF